MYNYNYAFNPYNVPYYTDGQREPYYDNYYQIMPYYSPDPGPGGGHGGGQWDGHGGGHGGGQWDGHGGGHGHGHWGPRCRRIWVHGFGWTWVCR